MPSFCVVTGNSAVNWPACTVTVAGMVTRFVWAFVSVTTVGVVGTREMVTCNTPARPLAKVSGGVAGGTGPSAVTTAAGGTTVIVLVTVPLSVAVTVAVPRASPDTGMATLVWPVGTITLDGTPIMVGALVVSGTVVSFTWAALIDSVRLPVAL